MDFLRKINRNVQESISILNEGIQITNGILEVQTVHLEVLSQISRSKWKKEEEEGRRCCLMEELEKENRKNKRKYDKEVKEWKDEVKREKSKIKLKILKVENNRKEEDKEEGKEVGERRECVLRENCIVKRFSESRYKESIKYVEMFLKTLGKVLEESNKVSRRVVENQSFGVLYELSQLCDVVEVLDWENRRVEEMIRERAEIKRSVLLIVGTALKILNEIVKYPVHIVTNSIRREYEEGKGGKKKFDEAVKQKYPNENISEYELMGSYWLIEIIEEEKKELDQYLYQLDTILDLSNNGRSVAESIMLIEELEGEELKEQSYGFVVLFQKLLSYNDVNWHISEEEEGSFCRWSRHHDSCTYQLYFEEYCCECTKKKIKQEELINNEQLTGNMTNELKEGEREDYCRCFWSRERCNFRVKVLLEELIRRENDFIKTLFKMVRESRETYMKSRLLGLVRQMMSQVESFMEPFESEGLVEVAYETLKTCDQDQFYPLERSIKTIKYQEYRELTFLSLISENDVTILMSFPPCTVESLLLINAYELKSRWQSGVESRNVINSFANNLIVTYTYYKCTYQSSKTLELSEMFAKVLQVVMETVMLTNYGSRQIEEVREEFVLQAVEKLSGTESESEMRERDDIYQVSLMACSLVILVNLAKMGVFVEYQVVSSMSNYLTHSMSILNLLAESDPELIGRLSEMTVNGLPEVYKYMLNLIYSKERVREEYQFEESVSLKMETIMNFEVNPILQLGLTLLDPYINMRFTSQLAREVFKLCHRMGMFSVEWETGYKLNKYLCNKCKELDSSLSQEVEDEKFVFYRKFLFNYTSVLVSWMWPYDFGQEEFFMREYNIRYLTRIMHKLVELLKTVKGRNLETMMLYLLKYLVHVTLSDNSSSITQGVDFRGLFEFVKLENGFGGNAVTRGMAAVVLLYLISTGVIKEEEVEALDELSRLTSQLYLAREFRASQVALKVDDLGPEDALGVEFEVAVKRMAEMIGRSRKTDLLGLFYWERNNFFNFSLPPQIFKRLIAFKSCVHPHLFGRLSRLLTRKVAPPPVKHLSDARSGSQLELVDDSALDQPTLLLKTLYLGELEFAQNSILTLESQLEVLLNAFQLSKVTNKNLRNRIGVLEKRLEGPSGEEEFNLELELEIERQRYGHLEKMYNQLLSQLNQLTSTATNNNSFNF